MLLARHQRRVNGSRWKTIGCSRVPLTTSSTCRPPQRESIRHYGFLANRHRADKLALCRRLLAAPAPAPIGDDNDCSDSTRNQCPCCGGRRADGADRPVSAIVSCKPVRLARQLMNAALSISRYVRPPLLPPRAENAALLSRLRRRVQYAARVGKSSARDRRFLPLAARCQVDAAPHWNHYRPHSRRPPR